MAENKKSFILYADSHGLIKQLPDEVAGRLLKHIFSYVNDENPTTDELLVNIAFEPIKQQLKRDLKHWENQKEQRSLAGKKGMENRWKKDNTVITKDNTVINPITKITDNVNVNVSVNDINNINNPVSKKNETVDWSNLLLLFNKITKKEIRVIPEKAKRQIKDRLKEGWTKEDLRNAIINCYNDEHHVNTNHKYCTLELISRPEKFERFATMKVSKANTKEETDQERSARLLQETKDQQR